MQSSCTFKSLLMEAVDISFLSLPDGRRISYRELGCSKESARKSLLVIHGLGSSRLAAMPGVSIELLERFGVRLVAIDRPGYGRSDPHPSHTLRSFTHDIDSVADSLDLGKKIWLLGFSAGGAYCWAAARYIPQRIAGIAMWCPVGCFWWKGISEGMRKEMFATLTSSTQRLFRFGNRAPFLLLRLYVGLVMMRSVGSPWVRNNQMQLSPPDQKHLQLQAAADFMRRDNLESLSWNKGFGMAQDLKFITSKWDFELEDVAQAFKGPIHIWQGDEDWLVPLSLQHWIKQQVPGVKLNELKGEGHLSWFCFNDAGHMETLTCLFGQCEEEQDMKDTPY